MHGVQAFINAFPGASVAAIREGFLSIGVKDNSILIFSELMDSASLFLTANCDTVYFVPAMCMRVTGIGSQYLVALRDSQAQYLDGDRSYRLTLPPDIPESRFWSVMLYDRQTRSMLQTDQPKPDIGSQSGTVEAKPRRLNRHLLRARRTRRQNQQLDPNRPRQRLLHDPPPLQGSGGRSIPSGVQLSKDAPAPKITSSI